MMSEEQAKDALTEDSDSTTGDDAENTPATERGFGSQDEPTAKIPSLKKKALLERDAERHRDKASEEE